jgi:glycosyltransferase involved in cell wall biosynthesis
VAWLSHVGRLGGGAERCLVESVRGLAERGVDVHVVVPRDEGLPAHVEAAGGRAHLIPHEPWVSRRRGAPPRHRAARARRNVRATARLSSLFRSLQPDVVLTSTLTVPSAAFAAQIARVPHVWYAHELVGAEGHGLWFDLGRRTSLGLVRRLSARVVTTSQTVASHLAPSIGETKLRTLHCAVVVNAHHPPRDPDGAGAHALRLICVGSLYAAKRQEDAVRAVALLARDGIDVTLTLVGDEPTDYGRRLRELAAENGVADRVDFTGYTQTALDLVAAADVAVTCSVGEAFGRAAVEAMKVGVPVVGAASAGTLELVHDGKTGLLYAPGDAGALAARLTELHRDRKRLEALGGTARAWAERSFGLARHTDELLVVLREAVDAA